MSTFVSLGNGTQPFPRLLGAVKEVRQCLSLPLVIQKGNTEFVLEGAVVVDFMSMAEFEDHIISSDIVIIHGGAGSIINAIRNGKKPLVMPRKQIYGELVDDHQVELAKTLEHHGKIYIFNSPEELKELITNVIPKDNRKYTNTAQSAMSGMIDEVLREFLEE